MRNFFDIQGFFVDIESLDQAGQGCQLGGVSSKGFSTRNPRRFHIPRRRPMSSSEEALLSAVAADFEADLPRLVYADWLEQQGDPQRAEFIRVQLKLANLGNSEKNTQARALRRREQDLLSSHRDRWLPTDSLPENVVRLRRGFPEFVVLSPDHDHQVFLKSVAAMKVVGTLVLRAHPRLNDQALSSLSGLLGVQKVDLSESPQLTGEGLMHLAELMGLKELLLWRCAQLQAASIAPLGRMLHLQRLSLSRCAQLEDAVLGGLVELVRLRRLNLSWCEQLTNAGLAHLAQLPNLQWLNVKGCPKLTKQGIAELQHQNPSCTIVS